MYSDDFGQSRADDCDDPGSAEREESLRPTIYRVSTLTAA
jgi:hypothetical protein